MDTSTKRQLVRKLAEVRSITERAVYKRAKQLADLDGLMSGDEALCLHALESGIRLTPYLDSNELSRIDQLRTARSGGDVHPRTAIRKKSESTAKPPRTIIVGELTLEDPLLPQARLNEAKMMATRSYPLVYIFENSVREFIVRIMRAAHGTDWWNSKVPANVRSRVSERQENEDKNPWHGKRGAHPIYYTDLAHLSRILNANWKDFSDYLPTQTWLTQKLDETEHSRNIIAHNNPLLEKDIKRIEVFLSDWQDQMKKVGPTLPPS